MKAIQDKISGLFDRASTRIKNTSTNERIALGLIGSYVFYKLVKSCTHRPKSLKGKIVFITGAANGIGRQMALALSKEGAKIAIVDIDLKKAQEVADQIVSEKGEAIAVYCDVTSIESVKKAASTVRTHLGHPQILINNAGIVSGNLITEIPIEKIERTFKVNVISHFYTIKEFLPEMIKNNEGHIVTIASLSGLAGASRLTDYSASKHAAVGLNEALRNELKGIGSNVKTTCINPFYIDTGMFQGAKSRYAFLFPVLKEDYVGSRVVKAIRNNEEVVCIPESGNSIFWLRALLSAGNCDSVGRALGMNNAMDEFTGRGN